MLLLKEVREFGIEMNMGNQSQIVIVYSLKSFYSIGLKKGGGGKKSEPSLSPGRR